MDAPGCHECGATWTRLGPNGCCAWAGGCETRIAQAAAADAVFDADYRFHFDLLPCGHTEAEHVQQWSEIAAAPNPFRVPEIVQRFLDTWYPPEDEPG